MLDTSSAKTRMVAIAWSGWLVSFAMLVLLFTDGQVRLVLTAVLVLMEMVLLGVLLSGLRRASSND